MQIRIADASELGIVTNIVRETITIIYPKYKYGYREIDFKIISASNGDYLCYDIMEKKL